MVVEKDAGTPESSQGFEPSGLLDRATVNFATQAAKDRKDKVGHDLLASYEDEENAARQAAYRLGFEEGYSQAERDFALVEAAGLRSLEE